MKISSNMPNLFRPGPPVGRVAFFITGVLLFGLKYNIDRRVAGAFDSEWPITNYLGGLPKWRIQENISLYLTIIALSLPFIWMGVVLVIGRLRALGWKVGWVMCFFIPFVNLFFFAALSAMPSKAEPESDPSQADKNLQWKSAAWAVVIVAVLGAVATAISTNMFELYGLGLFIALPFCLGMISVLIYGCRQPRTYAQSMAVCSAAITVAALTLLCFAMEGAICLIMAAPLAWALAILGGSLGHFILMNTRWRRFHDKILCLAVLAIPMSLNLEKAGELEAPLFHVTTSVTVNAPPNVVWRHVVSFAELPPPQDWFFKTGVAFPIRARISGCGAGAIRRCEFSTGPFVEPITVWDEPHLLRFAVTANPAPLEEWTPYRHIHPPHLDGFLASEQGQFLLTRNPGNTTLLEGTTWYRHHMWPADYWQIWSDFIIHRIHLRVLDHVKHLSEEDTKR